MKTLTKEQIILLHSQLIEQFGGSPGIRDEGLLDSAINAPFQTFNGLDLFTSRFAKAARLCFGLVKNHPFVDGNKRIGTHAMLMFLALNGIMLRYKDDELIELILSVAAGSSSETDVQDWIALHTDTSFLKYNQETLDAMAEAEQMRSEPDLKTYDVEDALRELKS